METKTQSFSKKFLSLVFALILSATAFLPAFEASAATVKISRKTITVAVGKTYTLKITGTDETVKWKTSNSKIAAVSKSGVVKGVRAGKATVSATVGKNEYKCAVTVDNPKLSATKKSVRAGTSFTLKVSGTKRDVKWYSSNTSVARVSQSGVVKTYKAGTAYITAKIGGKRINCKVTVTAKPSSSSNGSGGSYGNTTSDTVYITRTGEKYHRGTCSSLRKSKIAISRSNARARGYQPCKRCRP